MTSLCQFDTASGQAATQMPVTIEPLRRMQPGVQPTVLMVASVTWGLAIAIGCVALWNHAGTPASQHSAAIHWPRETVVPQQTNANTLLIFAHPHCPCTRATLRELERLVAECKGKLGVQVVFVQPPGTNDGWAVTDLSESAAAIPGVSVAFDRDGTESQRFGAHTSGEALLYDAAGRLVFQGGITPARGHEGDSAGRTAIAHWVAGEAAEHHAPVFGCSLLGPVNPRN